MSFSADESLDCLWPTTCDVSLHAHKWLMLFRLYTGTPIIWVRSDQKMVSKQLNFAKYQSIPGVIFFGISDQVIGCLIHPGN